MIESLDKSELNSILADKFIQIERLEAELKETKDALKNEMEVNERLHELNIDLKGRLKAAGQLMKVRVHPSSMQSLQTLLLEKQEKINHLRNTIEMALRLIPDDRIRAPYITTIRQVYQTVL